MSLLTNTFGKGYILPFDYAIIMVIIIIATLVAIGIYKALIARWVSNFRHPFNLRLVTTALCITLIGGLSYAFIRKVYLLSPVFKDVWLIPLILAGIWIVFTIVVTVFGKKVRK